MRLEPGTQPALEIRECDLSLSPSSFCAVSGGRALPQRVGCREPALTTRLHPGHPELVDIPRTPIRWDSGYWQALKRRSTPGTPDTLDAAAAGCERWSRSSLQWEIASSIVRGRRVAAAPWQCVRGRSLSPLLWEIASCKVRGRLVDGWLRSPLWWEIASIIVRGGLPSAAVPLPFRLRPLVLVNTSRTN